MTFRKKLMFAQLSDTTPCGASFASLQAVASPPDAPGLSSLRLAITRRAMARMLDVVDYGLVLLGDGGEVIYANEAARAEIALGHPLRIDGGKLLARHAADAPALRQALLSASRRAMQSLLSLGASAGAVVRVAVVPMAEPGESAASLLIIGKRQACEELSRDAFARQHALTLAEARVLKRLCEGEKPVDIARTLGVQLTTVRTQIGSIRMKTGTRDIAQVVQHVGRLPPLPCLMRRVA